MDKEKEHTGRNEIDLPDEINHLISEVYFEMNAGTREIVFLSPSIENLAGYKPEELIGVKADELLNYYHSSVIERMISLTKTYGKLKEFFLEVISKNEEIKYCEATTFVKKNPDSNQLIIAGIIRDRTDFYLLKREKERFESQHKVFLQDYRRFEAAIEHNPLSVIFTDVNGNITYANMAFSKLTGYGQHEITGKNVDILHSDFHNLEFHKSLWNTISSGHVWEGEILDKKKNGELFWVKTIIFPIRDDYGEIQHFLAIYEDITGKKRMEEMLTKARLDAEKANEAKSEFLATMSHEIRNPMNAVVGNIELLSQTPLNTQQKKIVKNLFTSSESLMHIINDVLDFSKIESGQLVIEYAPFRFADLINGLTDAVKPKTDEKNIRLIKETDPGLEDIALIGDKYRLNQILLNLLNNAIKFTEKGYVKLSCIRQKSADREHAKILFSVEDTGIGIAREKISSVFDKFKQEDSSTTRKYGGTGLGLAISKELTQLMGGDLHVESTKNVGSRFFFILDFKIALSEKQDKKSSVDQLLNDREVLKGKTFIVADDLEFNIDIAVNLLTGWGARCLTANNGKEAVELVRNHPETDMVLMDLRMPMTDGFEATQIIRNELHWQKPVLGLTGEAMKEKLEECFTAGMNDYILKPFRRKEFLGKILKNIKV